MHRHTYSGRKLSLDRGPRRALLRGQVTSLVLHEQITTTETRGKETLQAFEQLVTRAKKGGLANMRHVRSFLLTDNATKKLMEDLVPALQGRSSGHVRLIKTGARRGDNAPMAVLSVLRDQKTEDRGQKTEGGKLPATSDEGKSDQSTKSEAIESKTRGSKPAARSPKKAAAK